MSLINDMLKNLEQRKVYDSGPPFIALMNADEKFFLSHKKIFLISVLVSILFIVCLMILFKRHHMQMRSPILQSHHIETQAPLNPADMTQWLKPVLITGITFQIKENITEITLLLDHPALYRLDSNNINNQLSITIERSQLQSALPSIRYLNTPIQHLSTQHINGDTKLNLVLSPGSVIKYVNLNDDNKNPELVIAIEQPLSGSNPSEPNNQTHSASKFIKTQAMQSLLSQQYQAALNNIENGQYAPAIDNLSSLIKMDPNYHDARLSLAALLMDQGHRSRAKQVVEEGLTIHPNFLPFMELKARLLATEGKTSQALVLLQRLSPPINDHPEYYAYLAALYEQSNKDILAINIYKQLLTLNPHNSHWWFGLAISLDKLGHTNDAVEAYSKAMSEGNLSSTSIAYLQNRLQTLEEASNEKG